MPDGLIATVTVGVGDGGGGLGRFATTGLTLAMTSTTANIVVMRRLGAPELLGLRIGCLPRVSIHRRLSALRRDWSSGFRAPMTGKFVMLAP
jgi:hypothetical protein